jgi:hypothetical protein
MREEKIDMGQNTFKEAKKMSNVRNCNVQNQLGLFMFCKFQTMVMMESCSFLTHINVKKLKLKNSFFPTIGFGFS